MTDISKLSPSAAQHVAYLRSPEWTAICEAMFDPNPTLEQQLQFVVTELREAMECLEPSAPANGRVIDGWHASAAVLRAWGTLTSERFTKLLDRRGETRALEDETIRDLTEWADRIDYSVKRAETLPLTVCAKISRALRGAVHLLDRSSAGAGSPVSRSAEGPQESLLNPAHQVYFRAGLIACREYMARFVESQDPAIANSIRANWWPSLGPDFGPPRKLAFGELTSGEYGTPEFRCLTAEEVSPTLEALPVALGFLGDGDGSPASVPAKDQRN